MCKSIKYGIMKVRNASVGLYRDLHKTIVVSVIPIHYLQTCRVI